MVEGKGYVIRTCARTKKNHVGGNCLLVQRKGGNMSVCSFCHKGKRRLSQLDEATEVRVLTRFWEDTERRRRERDKEEQEAEILRDGLTPAEALAELLEGLGGEGNPRGERPRAQPVCVTRLANHFPGGLPPDYWDRMISSLTYLAGEHGTRPFITRRAWTDMCDVLGLSRIKGKNKQGRIRREMRKVKAGSYVRPAPKDPTPRQRREDRARTLEYVAELIWDGKLSSAVRALDSTSAPAERNADTLAALETVHPDRATMSPEAVREYLPLVQKHASEKLLNYELPSCSVKQAEDMIGRLSSGSSAGPSGLSGRRIKQLLKRCHRESGQRDRFLVGVARIVQAILQGRVTRALFASRLVALTKPKGGVRPIAVGEVLIRLAGKFASEQIKEPLGEHFAPVQFGVAVPNAVESVAAIIRAKRREGYTIISLDFANAFNAAARDALFLAHRYTLPCLSAYYEAAYEKGDGALMYGDTCIASAEGVRQGDPLSPTAFATLLHPILAEANKMCPEYVQVVAYHDDVYLIGNARAEMSTVLDYVVDTAKLIGLTPKPAKSWVCGGKYHTDYSIEGQSLPVLEDITVLGIPIGGDAYIRDRVKERADKALRLLDDCAELNLHELLMVMRHCITSKLTFLTRSLDPRLLLPLAKHFDDQVRQRLARKMRWAQGHLTQMLHVPAWAWGVGLPLLQMDTLVGGVAGPRGVKATLEAAGVVEEVTERSHFRYLRAQEHPLFQDRVTGWPSTAGEVLAGSSTSKHLRFALWGRVLDAMAPGTTSLPWGLVMGAPLEADVYAKLMRGFERPSKPPGLEKGLPVCEKISILHAYPRQYLRGSDQVLTNQLLVETGSKLPSDLMLEERPGNTCPVCRKKAVHGHGAQCSTALATKRHEKVKHACAGVCESGGMITRSEAGMRDEEIGQALSGVGKATNNHFERRTDLHIVGTQLVLENKVLNVFQAAGGDSDDILSAKAQEVRDKYSHLSVQGWRTEVVPVIVTTSGTLWLGPYVGSDGEPEEERRDPFEVLAREAEGRDKTLHLAGSKARVALALAQANLMTERQYTKALGVAVAPF
jgi:hypothetical protein